MTTEYSDLVSGSRRTYLDFEVQMFKSEDTFYAQVLYSPAGGTTIEKLDFESLRSEIKEHFDVASEQSSPASRNLTFQPTGSGKLTKDSMKAVGTALFKFLFTKHIFAQYYLSLNNAGTEKKGLRLKLRIEARELSTLPWEVLFDSNRKRYIGLWNDTPIVRYIETSEPVIPLAVESPLLILGVISVPERSPEFERLKFEKEVGHIEEALKDLQSKNLVELCWAEGQTLQALEEKLNERKWHVLHFIGHGGFDDEMEGYLVLADDKGEPKPVEATILAHILAPHKSLRFVFLNSCDGARGSDFESTASALIWAGIPAVLAMRSIVSDDAAIKFSRAFYMALVERWPVDAAVTKARKVIDGKIGNTPEWGTPVLYSRSPDGEIFVRPNVDARRSKLVKYVVAILILACLGVIIWRSYLSTPTASKNTNKSVAPIEIPPPVKCDARITIDKIPGDGIERDFHGRIENAPKDAKIWLFRRNSKSEWWSNQGQARVTDMDWSIKAAIRSKDEFPDQFEIAAVVSQEVFAVNQKIESLPSECVSSIESDSVPKPEFQITRINGAGTQGCGILQWQSNTFEGRARNVFENETIWVIVYGYDSTHNQTGHWPETATVKSVVDSVGKWTVNIKISDGKSFDIYVDKSNEVSQSIPLKCISR